MITDVVGCLLGSTYYVVTGLVAIEYKNVRIAVLVRVRQGRGGERFEDELG